MPVAGLQKSLCGRQQLDAGGAPPASGIRWGAALGGGAPGGGAAPGGEQQGAAQGAVSCRPPPPDARLSLQGPLPVQQAVCACSCCCSSSELSASSLPALSPLVLSESRSWMFGAVVLKGSDTVGRGVPLVQQDDGL